ncbi:hypothetical protein ACF1G0_33060 [Streptomyces sp. NPDC013953]|uniref:hypothetical protein n=1 Tax=Streptomyces sp. NPDC013953 TaxID=3364868 RepID=UPI0036FFC5B3
MAATVFLGIVGGTVVGYGVQAQRAPTPLPALAQAGLAYPEKPLREGPEPLGVEEDRARRTGGDLRKVLIDKPKGARDAVVATFEYGELPHDGWLSPDTYAKEYLAPDAMLRFQLSQGIRRVAAVDWESSRNHDKVAIRLVQFGPGFGTGAAAYAEDQLGYMAKAEGAGNPGRPIKGSGNGRCFVYPVEHKPGRAEGLYHARALGYRGDVMFDIHIFDAEPISDADIQSLAARQLERL